VDPLEDATGSPFVRLTGSCTVPEFSEVEELSGEVPTLLRSSFSLRPDAYLKRSNRLTHLGHSWSAEVKALRGRYLEGTHFVALWFAVLGSAKFVLSQMAGYSLVQRSGMGCGTAATM